MSKVRFLSEEILGHCANSTGSNFGTVTVQSIAINHQDDQMKDRPLENTMATLNPPFSRFYQAPPKKSVLYPVTFTRDDLIFVDWGIFIFNSF